ncbi:hypothetical protein [Nonomuraea recticatena]|uniref:hypothetical protein n=1 Tax=Nonomuraea recticatena TaxID=46178 RepID=UPI0031F777A0
MPLLAQQLHVRLSPDGGKNFPAGKHSRPLAPLRPQLPSKPSTISVYDTDGRGQVLFLDFDVTRAVGLPRAQAVARVTEHAQAAIALIEQCGGRAISTLSPSGGRHVIIRWSSPLPWTELLRLTRSLAVRFPTLDVQPMASRKGQIRPPGALHKIDRGQLTGWMTLTMPIEQAERILRHPCGSKVWVALQQELTAELAQVDSPSTGSPSWTTTTAGEAGRTCPDCDAVVDVPLDADGYPWLPRTSSARPLRPEIERLAQLGDWENSGAQSASEPRLGLLNSMAAAGLRLGQIRTRMHEGTWAGLARLLDSRRQGPRSAEEQERLLQRDWQKAVTWVAWRRHVRNCNTSQNNLSTAPPPRLGSSTRSRLEQEDGRNDQRPRLYNVDSLVQEKEGHDQNRWGICTIAPQLADERVLSHWQEILQWRTCIWLAEQDQERTAAWGRAAPFIRLLLRAMVVAARMDGSTQPAFGCRSLSQMTGADYTVVARHLKRLREEDDPLIELVEAGRGKAADRYRLRVPDRYRDQARWIRWRGGLIDVLHPALHMFGPVVALVLEVLSTAPTGATAVAHTARVSRSAGSQALRLLATYNLAVRDGEGWIRGAADLDAIAIELGGDIDAAERRDRYREHRRIWHAIVESWEQEATEPERPERVVAVGPHSVGDAPWPQGPTPEREPDGAFAATAPAVPTGPNYVVVPRPRRRARRSWPDVVPGRTRLEDHGELLTLFELAGIPPD